MMSVLDKGCVGVAALAAGIGRAALEAALGRARTKRQFDRVISEFRGIRWMLADMAEDIGAARLPVHSATAKIDRGKNAAKACSMGECFAGDIAAARTASAAQIFGGSGRIGGFGVERVQRGAKITPIHGGANQIQRVIIARGPVKHGARA